MIKLYSLLACMFCIVLTQAQQNVGIGENVPSSKLSIKGNLAVGDGYTTTSAPTDGAIIKGNVGIGTNSPGTRLEVMGGNIRIRHTGDAKYEFYGSSSDRGFVGWQATTPAGVYLVNKDNSPLYFHTTSAERMRIDDVGNVGIGTTSTSQNRLRVVSGNPVQSSIWTDGYTEDVSGIVQGNYVPSHSWNIANGSVGIFNDNGGSGDNVREWGQGPHTNNVILWKGQGSGSDADGGWTTNWFNIDHTKMYRVTIWAKRTGINGTGTVYLGCGDNNVTLLNNTDQTNPYFYYTNSLPQLDRWYLIVGYIHGSGDTSTRQNGGVYDGVTGQKVVSFTGSGNGNTDFKFKTSATQQQQRVYFYYNSNANAKQYFWDPKFEEVNGKELPISALLAVTPGNAGRKDWRPYGTPTAMWDGATGTCPTLLSALATRGGATISSVDYCGGTGWNYKRMVRLTSLSQEAQSNNTAPANGVILTAAATPNVHNTLLLSFIDYDRWSSVSVWLCNSSGTPVVKLMRNSTNGNSETSQGSTYCLAPRNTPKETAGHGWIPFPITADQVKQYMSGGNLKFCITAGPNNEESTTLWFSGYAVVPNASGFTQHTAVGMHWGLNGVASSELTWHGIWNDEGLARVDPQTTKVIHVKVVDPTKDLLVTFYEHNQGWYGGYPVVTVGADATEYYPASGIEGIGPRMYLGRFGQRPMSIIIPTAVLQAQLTQTISGVPSVIKLNLKNMGNNNFYFKGVDTEIYWPAN